MSDVVVTTPAAEVVVVTTDVATAAVVVETTVVATVVTGVQGPAGPAGPTGPAGSAFVIPAAITLSGHRVLAIDATGQATYADQADLTATLVVGVSAAAVDPGADVPVVQAGPLDWPAGGLVAGLPLFLGSAGFLTQTPPVTGWLRQIGVATSASIIAVAIGPAFYLGD